MDDSQIMMMPYIAHEAEMARMEREHDKTRAHYKKIINWLFAVIIILTLSLVGMFVYEAQFVDETWTSEATTDGGGTAIANMDGEVFYNGESASNSETENP